MNLQSKHNFTMAHFGLLLGVVKSNLQELQIQHCNDIFCRTHQVSAPDACMMGHTCGPCVCLRSWLRPRPGPNRSAACVPQSFDHVGDIVQGAMGAIAYVRGLRVLRIEDLHCRLEPEAVTDLGQLSQVCSTASLNSMLPVKKCVSAMCWQSLGHFKVGQPVSMRAGIAAGGAGDHWRGACASKLLGNWALQRARLLAEHEAPEEAPAPGPHHPGGVQLRRHVTLAPQQC